MINRRRDFKKLRPTLSITFIMAVVVFIFLSCSHFQSVQLESQKKNWPKEALRGANVSTSASVEDLHHFAKNWGGKVVRVLHLSPLSNEPPYLINEKVLADMYRTSSRALDEGLAVVFAPGVAMEDNDLFFSKKEYQAAFVEFWKEVALHFKNEKRIIAYDLMNEPHDKLAREQWSDYARELTKAIRSIDDRHSIIVEAPEWSWPSGFAFLKPTGDSNTIYSFHTYAPNEFTVQKSDKGFLTATEEEWKKRIYPGSVLEGELWNKATMEKKLAPVFEFANKNNVTIWCGEFGTTRWSKGAATWLQDMIDIFEAHKIGWAYYSYREWHAMDLEMRPDAKNIKTERKDNEFVQLLKKSYAK